MIKVFFVGCFLSLLAFGSFISNYYTGHKIGLKEVLISAHRGGPKDRFPENALETFQSTLDSIPNVMLEMDVMSTKEGQLVVMHDNTLNRTTTLQGVVKELSVKEVQSGFLIDREGQVTNMRVPTLKNVFEWAIDKDVFLSIDVKDKAIFHDIIDMVRHYNLKEKIEIITYSINDAKLVHNYDPDVFISMSIGNMDMLQRVLETNINPAKVSAFTGVTIKDRTFYAALANSGMAVTLGTMGNLDQLAKARGFEVFQQWKDLGINRFATDCPLEVFNSLNNK